MKLRKIISVFSVLLVLSLLIGCTMNESCDKPSIYQIKDGSLLLDKEGTIPCDLCEERGLENQVVVLESKYCGACQAAIPIIQTVAEELSLSVLDLDLSENEGQNKMSQLKIIPYYTPTMLVGCQVYVGGKTKEEYKKIFTSFLEQSK